MHSPTLRRATRLAVAATTAVTLSAGVGATAASASGLPSAPLVRVTTTNTSIALPAVLHAGRVNFRLTTANPNGSALVLFKLHPGVTLASAVRELKAENGDDPGQAAAATRWLTAHVNFTGGADTEHGRIVQFVEVLYAGRYYAIDGAMDNPWAHIRSMRVVGTPPPRAFPRVEGTVDMTSSDRIVPSKTVFYRHTTLLVRNVSDTLHFLVIQRVKPGTTDASLQKQFDAALMGQDPGPDPTLPGTAGLEILSPHNQSVLQFNLPAGRYVLACFIADDRTGMPHAFMGMHKVITLR